MSLPHREEKERMKVIIQKQFDKSGDEYLNEEEVTADIKSMDDTLFVDVDDVLYEIPIEVLKGVL